MKKVFLFMFSMQFLAGSSQPITPGFEKSEYIDLLLISIQSTKREDYREKYPKPDNYSMIYQSGELGLDNSWDLWINDKGRAVISIRGTTDKMESWLENFYAAMVPAEGEITLPNVDDTFNYKLSEDPDAAIHVGWLVGLGYLSQEIVPKIDSLNKEGIKDFLIMGHSQGGAIAYLLTSYLHYQQKAGNLDPELTFKTYCSASPKPGNLYYAYDFERITQGGYAFLVINPYDWVPEVPISIQTLKDFNPTNPFVNAESMIKEQEIPKRWFLKHAYNKLNKPTLKAQRNYEKYLGKMTYKMVEKNLPGLIVPEYLSTNNYMRAGIPIIMEPGEIYLDSFPEHSDDVFEHHFHQAYLTVAKELPEELYKSNPGLPEGKWIVENKRFTTSNDSLPALPVPYLKIEPNNRSIKGNTGCNSFSGEYLVDGERIKFLLNGQMTLRACPGNREENFLNNLSMVNGYHYQGNRIYLTSEGIDVLVLKKE
ncbi:META domain-containing protein [Mangrovivirga sp. M17]|uniref:META domain-containing protein n=1 Tax=Mangrovivirga halotolerans TaxID=2993936 RepID=A0ABT3RT83_9BACT|nr:META domain-containing protein [Mangrovivirga halotolerans]MCX2744457.1 META domain-containing protein [Mangrovivirga halotolerans]